jgi:hypothetical protein
MLSYESRRLGGWAKALGLGQEDVLIQLLNDLIKLIAQLEQLQRYSNQVLKTKKLSPNTSNLTDLK